MRFQFDTRAFIVVVVLVLALGAACSAIFWGDLSATENGKSESLSTTVRNVMLILAAILALPLAIWRGWVAEQQVKATQDSVDAAHEAISNQRFQAAAQMLGHDLNAVRLGAIHTLAQLSQEDRDRYYLHTARLLASFVRQPRSGDQTNSTRVRRGDGREVREDVNAALNFIGSRNQEDLDYEKTVGLTIDLHDINFERWDLSGMNLARCSLRDAYFGRTLLQNVDFTDTDLSECSFGGANVEGAIFRRTNLAKANLTRWYIDDDGRYAERARATRDRGPVKGLVQAQLDEALDELENPPRLRDVKDAATGEQLLWHGRQPT